MAADMPMKVPLMVAPVSNWSGFYIGCAYVLAAFNNCKAATIMWIARSPPRVTSAGHVGLAGSSFGSNCA